YRILFFPCSLLDFFLFLCLLSRCSFLMNQIYIYLIVGVLLRQYFLNFEWTEYCVSKLPVLQLMIEICLHVYWPYKGYLVSTSDHNSKALVKLQYRTRFLALYGLNNNKPM